MNFVVKKGSKLLSIILVLMVGFSMFPATVFATADDGKAEIYLEISGEAPEGGYEAGDIITVSANIADNPGFVVGNFNMIYDTSVLELADTAERSILFNGIISTRNYPSWVVGRTPADSDHGGTTTVGFANNLLLGWDPEAIEENGGHHFMGNGKLFEITYKVKDGAPAGDHPLGIQLRLDDATNFIYRDSESGELLNVPVNFTGTSFTVKGEEQAPDPIALSVYESDGATNEDFANRTLVMEYTTSELEELATDGATPVSGMHTKGSVWTVISTNNYVTVEELFIECGIGEYWIPGASFRTASGSDGFAATATYDTVTSDSWFYPELGPSDSPTSDSVRYPVPAVIGITSSSSSPDGLIADDGGFRGHTTGDSEKYNVEYPKTGEAPRSLYGITEEEALSFSAAGARYPSRITEITLIKAPAEVADVDKSALGEAIAAAEALAETDYTSETWALLAAALEAAVAVNASEEATQDEVNVATEELLAKTVALEAAPAEDVVLTIKSNKADVELTLSQLKKYESTVTNWSMNTTTWTSLKGITIQDLIKYYVEDGDNVKSISFTALNDNFGLSRLIYPTDEAMLAWEGYQGTDDNQIIGLRSAVNGTAGNMWISRVVEAHVLYVGDVDKTALDSEIAKADALVEADYTSETWTPFAEALAAANATKANGDATQDDVDAAKAALTAAIAALVAVPSMDIDTSWYNTTDTVFNISTKAELKGLAAIVNGKATVNGTTDPIELDTFAGKTINLTADIDLAGDYWVPIGQNWSISDNSMGDTIFFSGTFDGNGHYVDNMTIGGTDYSSGTGLYREANALFGMNKGVIKDVGVRNMKINTYRVGAGIAGINYGTVTRTMSSGSISANGGGGSRGTAGIVGTNYGDVRYSYSSATVYNAYRRAGGVVGFNAGAAVIDSVYFVGFAESASLTYSGSIAATNDGTITNSFWLQDSSRDKLGVGLTNPTGSSSTTMFTADEIGTILEPLGANFMASSDESKTGPVLVWEEGTPAAKAVASIIATPPTSLTYEVDDTFDPAGFEPTAFYNDGTKSVVDAAGISYDKTAPLTAEDTSVTFTVTHDGFTQTFEYPLEVNSPGLKSIAFKEKLTSATATPGIAFGNRHDIYANGETFNKDSLAIEGTFGDGTSRILTSDELTVSPESMVPGVTEVAITATVDGATASEALTFPVIVLDSAAPEAIDGVYQLSTADDMTWFAEQVNAQAFCTTEHVNNPSTVNIVDIDGMLLNDIDLSDAEYFAPIGGNAPTIATKYTGTFDGNGNTLKVAIETTNGFTGLFGYTVAGTIIKNLTLDGYVTATTASTSNTGGIVGSMNNGTIENVVNNATVTAICTGASPFASQVGGIAGSVGSNTTINNVVNNGIVSAQGGNVGGIAGNANIATFTDVKNTADITSTSSTVGGITGGSANAIIIQNAENTGDITGTSAVGGISGTQNGAAGMITEAVNYGKITGTSASGSNTGGIVAGSNGSASDVTNYGDVTGGFAVGGIIGNGSGGTMTRIVNHGSVTGADEGTTNANGTGGLAGNLGSSSPPISDSYNTGNVSSGNLYVGGLVGAHQNASARLTNCYNLGDVTHTATASRGTRGLAVGGISGWAGSTAAQAITIQNTYNAGTVSATFAGTAVGGTIGLAGANGTLNNTANISNNYFLDTATEARNAFGVAKTSEELKALADTLGESYKASGSYPVLTWQNEEAEEPGVDKTSLEDAITTADTLVEADYTSATWALFAAALETAIAINANEEATQDEVNLAAEELLATIAALEAAPEPVALTIKGGSEDIEVTMSQLQAYETTVNNWDMLSYPAVTWTSLKGITIADFITNFVEDGANVDTIAFVAEDGFGTNRLVSPTDEAILAWEGYRSDRPGNQITGLRSGVNGAQGNMWVGGVIIANVAYKEVVPTDKTALAEAIATAQAITDTGYTTESWDAFAMALKIAVGVNADDGAPQDQVDAVKDYLISMMEALEKAVEPVALTIKGGSSDIEVTMSELKEYESTVTNWAMGSSATWTSLKGILIADLIEYFVEDGTNVESIAFVDSENYGATSLVYPTSNHILAWEGYRADREGNQITSGLRSATNGGSSNSWVSGVVTANVVYKAAPAVDKAALGEAITAAEALAEADYTVESWAAFAAAFAAAQAVNADGDATQEAIDGAVAALAAAVEALAAPEPIPVDKDALAAAITAAEALAEADYTVESWAAFAAALAAAQAVNADADATQEAIDDAVTALATAKVGLELNPATVGPTIEVGKMTGAPGESIIIPVQIINNPGFGGYSLAVDYDKSKVEKLEIEVEPGMVGSNNLIRINGEKISNVSTGDPYDSDGMLFNLVVKLNDEGYTFGEEIPISIVLGDEDGFVDIQAEKVELSFTAGSITVLFDRTPVAADYSFTPETAVYNGNAQGVTVTKENPEAGDVLAVYYNGSKTAPTNAGTYTISVDVAAGTNYKAAIGLELGTYTITKADSSTLMIEWPEASALLLGKALSESMLTGGSTELGSFAWEDATYVPTETGKHPFNVVFTPNDETLANYDIAESVVEQVEVLIFAVAYDINGDGRFTIADVVMAQNYVLGTRTLTADQIIIGDVDGDGDITAADVMNLQRMNIGLEAIL